MGDISARVARITDPVQEERLDRVCYLAAQELPEENDRHPDWDACKVEEMRSLVLENNVWYSQLLPSGRKAISSKWVVKWKEVPTRKRKGRFTPRGFAQQLGVDYQETYAPVAKMTTLRVFLSLVAILSLFAWQLDVKTAFLNANLEELIFCMPMYDHVHIMHLLLQQTKDTHLRARVATQIHDLQQGAVLRLRRAVYGLKQAPRAWWQALHNFLESKGFKRNPYDVCLYTLHVVPGLFCILLIYVDDILVAASTERIAMSVVDLLRRQFKLGSEGPLRHYLNIVIQHHPALRQVWMNMAHYVEQVFARFKMVAKPAVLTPMQKNLQLPSA